MREPIDTNLHMPHPLSREAAEHRLMELLPPDLADQVWDGLIAPLYDAQQMALHWTGGRCRHCRAVHPDGRPAKTPDQGGHSMRCPLYVGPLQHRPIGGGHTFTGWKEQCSCGQSYPNGPLTEPPIRCPDADEDWRGPRPEVHWEQPVQLDDIRIDVFSNMAGCHVRVTHTPTNLVATVDGTTIGQVRARERALAELRQKINDKQQEQPHV